MFTQNSLKLKKNMKIVDLTRKSQKVMKFNTKLKKLNNLATHICFLVFVIEFYLKTTKNKKNIRKTIEIM